ncbi:hypothetical protein [Tenacibaculum ovolyticum]|uniref:hypothetical protein n=1 Tax=Tenacibaculum ovolyticum TaxID=104270 RepID=UPI003BAD31DB
MSSVYMVNIEEITDDLKKNIDKNLVSICVPNSNLFDLKTIKKSILNFLKSKNKKKGRASNITMGYIAEFFNHLFLSNNEFKQEFSFFNLEENSMKKGFDGVYTNNGKYWILESKSSGKSNSLHKDNFKIAYNDLKGKVSGKVKNNPWLNAFSHIKSVSSSNTSLIKTIEQLSVNYINEKYSSIEEFNIIPCSTIILENNWSEIDIKATKKELKKIIDKEGYKKYKELIIICLNKKSLTHFTKYLEN